MKETITLTVVNRASAKQLMYDLVRTVEEVLQANGLEIFKIYDMLHFDHNTIHYYCKLYVHLKSYLLELVVDMPDQTNLFVRYRLESVATDKVMMQFAPKQTVASQINLVNFDKYLHRIINQVVT